MSNVPDTDEFDPYRIWLSIPKAEQPPNHYRLLGVSPFEADYQVIQEAADRQVAHLKTKQTGARVALSQQLLTEVATAAGVLLNPDSKAKYDAKLRTTLPTATKAKPPAPLPQARSLPVQPLPPQPQYQQPNYQQPGYSQPGYQQPAYQQPGYQQPAYQQPGYQQPGYAQPVYQQPAYQQPQSQPVQYAQQPTQYPQQPPHQTPVQPLRPQPLRPVALSQPAENEAAEVSISVDSSSADGSGSVSGDRPRRKDNTGMELVKVVIGGAVGLTIGAIFLVMIGKSDFLYSLMGMDQPVEVVQSPKIPTSNGSGPKKTNLNNTGTPIAPNGSNGSGASSSGTNSQNSSSSNPGSSNATGENGSNTSVEPNNGPNNTSPSNPSNSTTNNSAPGNSTTPSNPTNPGSSERVMQPSQSIAARQSGLDAMRESLNFLSMVYSHLEGGVDRQEHKSLLRDQRLLISQVLGGTSSLGPLPPESGLTAYRKNMYTLMENVDRQYQSRGVNPIFSGKLLANFCLTVRPDVDPQGRIYKANGTDEFPQKLLEYADGLLTMGQQNRAYVDAHDRLYYLAMAAQVLHYSYLRGNADQLSSCVLLDAICTETGAALSSESEKRKLQSIHSFPLKAAGLASLGGDIAADPRTNFRGTSTFMRQPDGKWFESNPTRGLVVYLERDRTPSTIELVAAGQPGSVKLTLGWSITASPTSSNREVYAEGDWQFSKPSRSLIPKLVLSFPGNASATGVNPANPATPVPVVPRANMPGTAVYSVGQVKPGDRVHILWGSSWWPGTVLSITGDIARIHYDNHDASSDENVTADRLRKMSSASGNTGLVSSGDPNTSAVPREQMPGTAISSVFQLRVSDRVHALIDNSWWPAAVTTINGDEVRVLLTVSGGPPGTQSMTVDRLRKVTSAIAGMNPPGMNQPGFAPSAPSAPPANEAKKLWRHKDGFIEYEDGVWRELAPTGDYFTLSVLSQSDEVVEVERTPGGVRLRLYDNRCEFALSPYTQYTEAAKGSWTKRIEEVELDAAQANALKRNCDTYAEAIAKAKKNMVDRFTSSISSVKKRIGNAESRLATISLLEAEQERFERDGLLPWSQPMKIATADYMTALGRARGTAESAFDRAIDYFVNHNQPDVAHGVLVLKQKTLAPMVVARLIPRDVAGMAPPRFGGGGNFGGGVSDRTIPPGLPADVAERLMRERGFSSRSNNLHRLWSNGNLDDAFGPSKWLANNSGVGLSIVRASSTVRDAILISEKGDEFAAQSSQGSSYNYQGTFASALEPYEKRPEVKYVPKIKPAAAVKTEPGDAAKPEDPKPTEPAATATPAPAVPAPITPAPPTEAALTPSP